MKRPSKWIWVGAVTGLAILAAIATLDMAGVLRPAPRPEALIRRMSEAWGRAESARADIIVGFWGAGSSGPMPSFQWWKRDREWVMGTKDEFGFYHSERWERDLWQYYQPGADLLVNVRLTGVETQPYAAWHGSRYPSLDALIRLLRNARITGPATLVRGQAERMWQFECEPVPDSPELDRLRQQEPEFLGRVFGARWTVWVSDQSGLPTHIQIPGQGTDPSLRIGVTNVQFGQVEMPADWRSAAGTRTNVKRTMNLTCDVAKPGEMAKTQARIRTEVDRWRKTIYKGARSP